MIANVGSKPRYEGINFRGKSGIEKDTVLELCDGFKYWTKDVNWERVPEYDGDVNNTFWSKIFINMKDFEIQQFIAMDLDQNHRSSKELLENLPNGKFDLFLQCEFNY